MQRSILLPRGPPGVPDQICGGGKPGTVSQKLKPSAEFAGGKSFFTCPSGSSPAVMAKLIVDDLRAVYGITAGTGASSSAGVRKNVETTERAFVVLHYLCSPEAIG